MFEAYRRYADFQGRSKRSEYWWFFLAYMLAIIIGAAVDLALLGEQGLPLFTAVALLGSMVPSIAVAVRRLHDIDVSGWWVLALLLPVLGYIAVAVIGLVPGTPGPNRFGPAPGEPQRKLAETFS